MKTASIVCCKTKQNKKTSNTKALKVVVASPRIELGSGASETLILSIVLRGHYEKEPRTKMPGTKEASKDNDQKEPKIKMPRTKEALNDNNQKRIPKKFKPNPSLILHLL